MSNNQPFRFKQFEVYQQYKGLKVNTDGVLLGAWADLSGAKTILDIGTGTGVIALMLAQRNSSAIVDAIDIDRGAFLQANENFAKSPWKERLTAYHTSLQTFSPNKTYDCIVSNPPYFKNSYQSPKKQINVAKHNIEMNYTDLLEGIKRLLTENGHAFTIIPFPNISMLSAEAKSFDLYITRQCDVNSTPDKPPYVSLLGISKMQKQFVIEQLTIQSAESIFTNEYKKLTVDFYLNF